MSNDLVAVHTVRSRFEADLLLDALKQEGIPVLMRTFEETAYDGLFVPQRGWGKILVPKDQASRAVEIIRPLLESLEGKKLYQDPADTDPQLWEKLAQADPQSVFRNSQIRYDSNASAYVVPFLNGAFRCYPERRAIEISQALPYGKLNFEYYLVILHYLLEAVPDALSGKWVSEQEIPGGNLFFRGPHGFQIQPLIDLFGLRPELFSRAAEKLDGTRFNAGDVAYRFWALPRIPLLYVLWKGDDEFEPALHIRFDATIHHHLHTLDTIWALVNLVSRNLLTAGKQLLAESSA